MCVCFCVCVLLTELRDLIDTHRENYTSFQMLCVCVCACVFFFFFVSVYVCVLKVFSVFMCVCVYMLMPTHESCAHVNRISSVHGVFFSVFLWRQSTALFHFCPSLPPSFLSPPLFFFHLLLSLTLYSLPIIPS